ncbi:MAG: SMI1/KNR4 family protein [Proteobacteria bacterium]|nr:SMI1/KNR4 family protein [Pseudomonadota bacterium]
MTNDHHHDNVVEAWHRVEAWLAREHPAGAQILAPGASAAQLEQLVVDFGSALPADLRASLATHNGHAPGFQFDWFVHSCAFDCGGGPFKLLSIDEMLDEWRLRDHALTLSRDENAALAGPAVGVRPVYWNRAGWLSLALGDDGDCFVVDLDPADDGTLGQVFAWYKADGAACVVAPSVEAWLARLAACMESAKMYVDAEGVHHEDE